MSGTGSDGTLGVRAVKDHGGLAVAEALPGERAGEGFSGMPQSAVATGLVDFLVPAHEMPAHLAAYARHLRQLAHGEGVENAEEAAGSRVREICAILLAREGRDFRHYKTNTLVRRIQRRMQVLQIDAAASYVERLREDTDEVERLAHELLIHVTSFFRDPEAFEGEDVTVEVDGEGYDVPLDVTNFRMEERTENGEHITPHVVEPSFGVDRLVYAILHHGYREDEVDGEERVYLELDPKVSPTTVAVFPLMDREGMDEYAEDLEAELRSAGFTTEYDDSGAIGRRYRRQDEVGTPFCITVDHRTLEDDTVTVRERDSTEQRRIPVNELSGVLRELRDTGRLLAYRDGEVTVELEGLGFANGVVPGPDGESLLVTETSRYRVTRYYHRGDRAGESEPFAANLPGYPDNIDRVANGEGYWVAVPAPRDATLDGLHQYPWLVRQLGKLPDRVLAGVDGDDYGLLLRLNEEGAVVDSHHDPTGGVFGVTSATPHEGGLYLGSLWADRLVRVRPAWNYPPTAPEND